MRLRRKRNHCPNCGAMLDTVYNYCPICGQENTSTYVSVRTLLGDFFNTYFALDSKFIKTLTPFFIKPGYLTDQYISGKRVSYAHPLRLYLILSIFFFFVFTRAAKIANRNDEKGLINISYDLNDVTELDSATRHSLKKSLTRNQQKEILRDIDNPTLADFKEALKKNTSKEEKEKLKSLLSTSAQVQLGLAEDILVSDSTALTEKKVVPQYIKMDSDDFIVSRLDWTLIEELKYNKSYQDEQLLDSMNLGELSAFDEHIALQTIRLFRNKDDVYGFILKNLPLMMLLLIPLFALVLKVLYIRRDQLYIKHLIHGLHLHSFSYVIYGIGFLIISFLEKDDKVPQILIISFIIVSTYTYISFLRVYDQGWFKTLVKFNITGLLYFICIVTFFLAEMLVSFLLY